MSPVEQSIEAQVTVNIDPELKVTIREDPVILASLDDKIIFLSVDVDDLIQKVYIDLDNAKDETIDPGGVTLKIYMPITFGKSVSGRKQTFGKSSLAIVNNISVIPLVLDTMPYPLGDIDE